jgi:hypothetical protein
MDRKCDDTKGHAKHFDIEARSPGWHKSTP